MSERAPAETTLRAGVAPQHMACLLHASQPSLSNAPLAADLANGLLYVRSTQSLSIEAMRRAAQALGGYVVVLTAPQAPVDIWGHAPEARALMQALKARWNPRCLFNPGAFIV